LYHSQHDNLRLSFGGYNRNSRKRNFKQKLPYVRLNGEKESMKPFDILVIGSLNMDLVTRTPYLPKPGETIHGHQFKMVPGGKGANQAAAIAKLGGNVAMLGKVGEDAFGENVLASLQSANVDISSVLVDPDETTGIATILVDDHGENSIVVTAGANHAFSIGDIEQKSNLFQHAKYLVMQLEIPLDVVYYSIQEAKKNDLKVVLNTAPAYREAEAFIDQVDYLLLNETEAQVYTDRDVQIESDAEEAVSDLLRRGVPVVILTVGARGALLGLQDQIIRIPTYEVEVVDTTAAGDAFTGGFTVALTQGASLEKAVRYANAVGALTVTRLGAQSSLPLAAEVEAFLTDKS
jgi:ribokinase